MLSIKTVNYIDMKQYTNYDLIAVFVISFLIGVALTVNII